MTNSVEITKAINDAVLAYADHANFAELHRDLNDICDVADVQDLIAAVEPHLSIPEVAGPVYERIVKQRPDDARALVVLASAYWLTGRGPDVVGDLANRAISSDPTNAGAWHLWALTESDPRSRMERWLQVSRRFPNDVLALANLADNATGIATEEDDPVARSIAIESLESLLKVSSHEEQRSAIESALKTLRGPRH